jgi:hypothetical protein
MVHFIPVCGNVRNPTELVTLPQIITFYFFQGFWSAMRTVTLDRRNFMPERNISELCPDVV